MFRILIRRYFSLVIRTILLVGVTIASVFLFLVLTRYTELRISRELQPFFGADMIISSDDPWSDWKALQEALSGGALESALRTRFSTTLISGSGSPESVQIVAYEGRYPQRWILEWRWIGEDTSEKIAMTEGLFDRFSRSWVLELDDRRITANFLIENSSDIGVSFWGENHLLILPRSILSGSLLLSSGSRLDEDLLISRRDTPLSPIEMSDLKARILALDPNWKVRTFLERQDRVLGTVQEITNYLFIALGVLLALILVVLRSALQSLWDELTSYLRVLHLLGYDRSRKRWLLGRFFGTLLFWALLFAGVLSSIALSFGASYQGDILMWVEWVVTWKSFLLSGLLLVLALPDHGRWSTLRTSFSFLRPLWSLFVVVLILFVLSARPLWSLLMGFGLVLIWGIGIFVIGKFLLVFFRWITPFRSTNFLLYDAIRRLVRPGWEPREILLLLILSCFVSSFFLSLSLIFREKLSTDISDTTNLYALNILDQDIASLSGITQKDALYSVLRARIEKINGIALDEFLWTEAPREFSREFNVTLNPLEDVPVRSGVAQIGTGQVSVDANFASRLGVTIGDRVTFLLSGRSFELEVASLRESSREGFRPFFFFQFHEASYRNAPKTYFLALESKNISASKADILSRTGPHVTFIDVGQIQSQIRRVTEQVLQIVSIYLSGICLFLIFALRSLFSSFLPLERQISRLYHRFGMLHSSLRRWSWYVRGSFLILSSLISGPLSVGLLAFFLRNNPVLFFDSFTAFSSFGMTIFFFWSLFFLFSARD